MALGSYGRTSFWRSILEDQKIPRLGWAPDAALPINLAVQSGENTAAITTYNPGKGARQHQLLWQDTRPRVHRR
jgi:hypothetical protein